MDSIIQALYKSTNLIKFGWNRESGAVSYKIYVGQIATSLTAVASNIPDVPSKQPIGLGKVVYDITIEEVRATLSLVSTVNFENKVFYFAITYVDSVGSESSIADSTVAEVPPVGIINKLMKDDPTMNRHGYVFSDSLIRWTKMAGSGRGAVITDPSDYYKANITSDYTYDGTDVKTILSYLSDATTAGSPAKLTTYTWVASLVTKIQITDSTV